MVERSKANTNIDKTAIVTGASEGIGKSIALTLLEKGFQVVLVSRNLRKLEQAVSQHEKYADFFQLYPADLTDPGQVELLVKNVKTSLGRVDLLVNNLGQGLKRELIDTTDSEWQALFDINLTSAFYMCRAVLPGMRKKKSGQIINIASRAGRRGEGAFAAYCAMKHGLIGLTRALADSEANFGITVNTICPGPVATDRMLQTYSENPHTDWVTPQEIAEAVLFLLSDTGKRMNGQCLDLFAK